MIEELLSVDTVVVPLILGLLGSNLMTAFVVAFFSRRKTKAETKLIDSNAEDLIHKTLLDYADGMREDIKNLKEDLAEAESSVDELRKEAVNQSKALAESEIDRSRLKKDNEDLKSKIQNLESNNI